MTAVRAALRGGRGAAGATWPRLRRPLRDALILVGLIRAAWYFFVQDIRPWEQALGVDARAYWRVDLAHPYAGGAPGDISAYLYSPAFAQLMAPLSLLPFEAYFALWTAASVAICAWLLKPYPWAGLMLILPIVYELSVGNVHFLMAAGIVLAFRLPFLWAFFPLTKITPGIGMGWFVFRRDWRSLVIALGTMAAIVAVSFTLHPSAWFDWYAFLTGSSAVAELLPLRIVIVTGLLAIGAVKGWRWVVPIAVWFTLPAVYVSSWVILLAAIRLREPVRQAA